MSGAETVSRGGRITDEELIWEALGDKLSAISGYDAIIWKIRAGYVAVLYGGLTVLTSQRFLMDGESLSALVVVLICGLSFAAFWIDIAYVGKKLRVVVARDELVTLALTRPRDRARLTILLHIAGEASPWNLATKNYFKKLGSNFLIMFPIYVATPTLALFWDLFTSGGFLPP